MSKKTWLITGISTGMGKVLAEQVMQHGDFVVGTFRHEAQVQTFNDEHTGKGFALQMDITNPDEVEAGIRTAMTKCRAIDVVVNNAGFGFAGAVEEASMSEVRDVFEANVFGTLHVTQSILPIMRQQRNGHIIQMSSHAGVKATAGFGIYNASKFALEGFSEALAAEIAPFGIKLTIVELGPFRTNFAGSSFKQAQNVIEDYTATAGAFRERMKHIHGNQEGDPQKAAQAVIRMVNEAHPPLRLPLGKIAVASITAKLESVHNDLHTWRELAESVVFE